jgi:poly(ADP-ribose) glycohydrolase ARH3
MALLSCHTTHKHSQAYAGAVAQASAIGMSVDHALRNKRIDSQKFLKEIAGLVEDIDNDFAQRILTLVNINPDSHSDFLDKTLRLFSCDVKAIESVPPALAAFVFSDTFEDTVTRAVNLGGDTDTIGAMAGAIAGAYYGLDGISKSWIETLENGRNGRDYVLNLASKAANIRMRQIGER